MKCAWQDLLNILPPGYRTEVDRLKKKGVWEIRLRLGRCPEFVGTWGSEWLTTPVSAPDILYVINSASKYSPWSAESISRGFLTTSGGHRIGICGKAVIRDGTLFSIKEPTGLCVRVASDHPGIAKGLPEQGNVLIIGKPGAGKTTLLRDLIRQRSNSDRGAISVVDERGELFPGEIFDPGLRTDILSGCSKAQGIEMLLRTMGPDIIAVDEITADADCESLIHSSLCGVKLLATAHAANREELNSRPIYQKLLSCEIFDWLVILQQDKSWRLERM